MTHPPTTVLNVDGRQTGGRKGLVYDWQQLLRTDGVADERDVALSSPAMPTLIGLLLT